MPNISNFFRTGPSARERELALDSDIAFATLEAKAIQRQFGDTGSPAQRKVANSYQPQLDSALSMLAERKFRSARDATYGTLETAGDDVASGKLTEHDYKLIADHLMKIANVAGKHPDRSAESS
ncbi:hypothetical protein [Paraburkholderia humisilvae]|uniref:hypothetical protein n=1 Tax=Paraburkholderia humisilvae TaxID=627669 RepID=UPI00158389DC|nr:hypothetical protein [Paraburkholderia humisilvae]